MLRKWKRTCAVALAVGVLLLVFPALAFAGVATVKIAVAGPISDGAMQWGAGMDAGARLAVSDYAAQLASAGVAVSVQTFDDKGDPSIAQSVVAPAIIGDTTILGVVGHVNSGCSIPASDVYQSVGLAMITPTSTNPLLTQRGRTNVYRTCGTDAGQGGYAADVVVKKLGLKRAYIVHDSTPYGKGLADTFARRFKADGGRTIGVAATSDADTYFKTLVKRIKAKKPTVIYYGGIYSSGGLLAKQLKASGVTATFVGGDGLLDSAFIDIAGRSKAEGALSTNVGLPVDQLPGGLAFRARYAAMWGRNERLFVDAYAYDAAQTILRAIIAKAEADGPSSLMSPSARADVNTRVALSDYEGVTGQVKFNAVGDTLYPAFSAWRVKSGSWRPCAVTGKPSVASVVHHGTSFTISGSLSPRHGAGSRAVTVKVYRKRGAVWVRTKSLWARSSDSGVFSTYSVSLKLATKGSYKVIASHADGYHPFMPSLPTFFRVN